MTKKGQRMNKYSNKLREEIVTRYIKGEGTFGSLSHEYGIGKNTIRTWVRASNRGSLFGMQRKGDQNWRRNRLQREINNRKNLI